MDTRTAALQLAAEKKAEMTKELTIELHLAAFTLAIAIVLGSQVPKLQYSNKLLPSDVIDVIKSSDLQLDLTGIFFLDEVCLSWKLFLKYLNSPKGYSLVTSSDIVGTPYLLLENGLVRLVRFILNGI